MIRRAMPVRALSVAATRIAIHATMRCVVVCIYFERVMCSRNLLTRFISLAAVIVELTRPRAGVHPYPV